MFRVDSIGEALARGTQELSSIFKIPGKAESLEILTESVTKCQEDVVQDILRTFLREMNGSFKMQFTDFNEALVQLK